jgi:DNA mismatch repair ATPase MutS
MKTKQQYKKLVKAYPVLKSKYPDAIILLRLNDCYIAFNEDATIIQQLAEKQSLSVTAKTKDLIQLPVGTLDTVLNKLVKAGNRVAIADSL